MSVMRIVYVDDQIDEILSRYISEVYCQVELLETGGQRIEKIFEEVNFEEDNTYESLLHNPQIRSANVILIDNHLFEERSANLGRFSGKQFKVILRKLLPFVEVLIITQDDHLVGENIIHKFSGRHGENVDDYYRDHLDTMLDTAIKEVLEFEALADDLSQSTDVEKTLVDRILQSLQGDASYDMLTKEDIDNLISSFKELKDHCGS